MAIPQGKIPIPRRNGGTRREAPRARAGRRRGDCRGEFSIRLQAFQLCQGFCLRFSTFGMKENISPPRVRMSARPNLRTASNTFAGLRFRSRRVKTATLSLLSDKLARHRAVDQFSKGFPNSRASAEGAKFRADQGRSLKPTQEAVCRVDGAKTFRRAA